MFSRSNKTILEQLTYSARVVYFHYISYMINSMIICIL